MNNRVTNKPTRLEYFVIPTCLCLSILVALYIPENILSHGWAKKYVEIMSALVPYVERMPLSSPIPDIARFYFSFSWSFIVPVVFTLFVYGTWNPSERVLNIIQKNKTKCALVTLFAGVIGYAFYSWPFEPDLNKHFTGLQLNSRFGLGFWGGFEACGLAMCYGWFVFLTRYLLVLKARSTTSP